MSIVNILVKNKSGQSRAYFLFKEAPSVSTGGAVYQNVYIAASTIPSGNGSASFTCKNDYFAVTGTNPGQKLGANVTVTTGDWAIAKLNQDNKLGSTFLMSGSPGNSAAFDPAATKQTCSQKGSFMIEARDFQYGNGANQFVGVGAQDPNDPTNIVPVATVEAQPGTQTIFTPKPKYYISWGTYMAGQIVDVTTIAEPAEVDFSGKAASKAQVVHNLDGTYTITFN